MAVSVPFAPVGTFIDTSRAVLVASFSQSLLSNVQLKGRGSELPFILQFNPDAFPAGQRVELRGRVTRAGQLIMRLPPRTISSAASQALGPLQLVPAP